jgi:hypothetical protein
MKEYGTRCFSWVHVIELDFPIAEVVSISQKRTEDRVAVHAWEATDRLIRSVFWQAQC